MDCPSRISSWLKSDLTPNKADAADGLQAHLIRGVRHPENADDDF